MACLARYQQASWHAHTSKLHLYRVAAGLQEPLADFFGQLSPGIYQLRLHKQRHKCFHERSFQIVLFGRVNSKRETTYYELMHDNELTITTEPFQVDMQNPWVHLMNPPSGLQSLQLHKLQQWDLIKVSPVFVTSNTPLQFMDASSAGFDEDGNSIYISVRFGNHAELGRSSSGYRFLYGRYGSYREESAPHKQFQGKAAWPGLLVNLSCYKWIPTDLQRVQSLKKRVVYLGQAEEGTLHAVRVLFRGWRHATLPNGEQSAVMQSEGRVISLLPGKFVFGKDRPDYAMFTWKGRATGGPAVRLADNQEFQMLCYRVFLE